MAFANFNAVPHYAYLKLKMPGPRGVITISGNTERSLRMEEYVAALAAESRMAFPTRATHRSLRPRTRLDVFGAHLVVAAQINLSFGR